MMDLNKATELIDSHLNDHFKPDARVNDPLHIEMEKDFLRAANMLYDSLPESFIRLRMGITRIVLEFYEKLEECEKPDLNRSPR